MTAAGGPGGARPGGAGAHGAGAAGGGAGSTWANEGSLPRVPLPTLADSGRRLLEWCAPLLDEADLARTREAVDQLLDPDGPGPVLQRALAERDTEPVTHSWLDDFWEARYLGRRDRIAGNANFFFLFEEAADRSRPGQLERAAELILGALHHKRQVDDETLPPATRRGEPQSMVQHRYLFSSTRIPGARQDTARTPYTDDSPGPSAERHIVVLARGRMARVEVLGEDGTAHTAEELVQALAAAQDLDRAAPGTSVGHLTTMDRAGWAAARDELLAAHPANAEALDTVERALFCVALEEGEPAGDDERCARLLHGDSANRWFDKSVTFVVFADGTAGINTEHCRLDGTTVLALVDSVCSAPAAVHADALGARAQGTPAVAAIDWELTPGLRKGVEEAGAEFAAFGADQAARTIVVDDLGADRAKALGVSPDALAQLAYQLAHARARGRVGPTYESIATTQFHHGRTEAMRVVTPEIVAFVAAMDDPTAGPERRRAALEAAAAAHTTRAGDCRAGRAPEQHLWELSLLGARQGGALAELPPLAVVDSPGWHTLRDDHLSTSSAPSANVRVFGFGSTGTRCIGVAYVLLPGRLTVHLSAPRAAEDDLDRFAAALRVALVELPALLEETRSG